MANYPKLIEQIKWAGFEPQYTRPQDSIVRKGYAISGELKGYKASMQDIERFADLVLSGAMEELHKACAERDAYQQAADKMAAEHKAEREALQAENERLTRQWAEWSDSLDSVMKQRNALQAKLDAAPKAPTHEQVEEAWRAGWAACRDAEYVGQEAEDEAWGMSQTCANADWENAAPKALEPLTAKEDWDIRGILASKLRVFHRTTEAEADELISLFSSMKSRTSLTQPEVVEAFCNTPHNVQYVSVFDAGVRFAEKHHEIGENTCSQNSTT